MFVHEKVDFTVLNYPQSYASQSPVTLISRAAFHRLSSISFHRSEVDDINLGLEHFYGDFNVVHTRLIASGVSSLLSLHWQFQAHESIARFWYRSETITFSSIKLLKSCVQGA